MRRANVFISIVLIVFSGFYAHLITGLPKREIPYTLGADFMPWVLTICLLFLASVLLLRGLFLRGGDTKGVTISLREVAGIPSLLAIIVAYIEAMIYFGYLFTTPLFIATMMLISGSRKVREITLFSIGIALAVYFFFHRFFNVPLPGGKIF